MTADDQLAALQAQLAAHQTEMSALRGLVSAMAATVARDTMPPHLQRVVAALVPVCGLQETFQSGEVIEHLQLAPSLESRRELRLALQAAAAGRPLDAHRVGLILRAAVAAGGRTDCGLMLLRPTEEGHSAVWMVGRVRGV